jgi:hypothetical protein
MKTLATVEILAERRARNVLKARAWRKRHPEQKAKDLAWRQRNKAHLSNYYYVRKYGLSLDAVAALLEVQGGACAICRTSLTIERKPRDKQGTALNVDHDHGTGAIRGILCHHCNAGLGYFRDSRAGLSAAINYLAQHERK